MYLIEKYLGEATERKDQIEMLDLAINYLTQAKKQLIKGNMKMVNQNVSYAMEKMNGKFWKDLFKEEKNLGEALKLTKLSFGDEVDQNRKSKEGTGSAKIDANIWSWADKKFAKANGSTITNQATAIQKQEIKINKPKGKMGVTTLIIKPLGDYIMVHDNKGGGMTKPEKSFFKV